MPSNLDPNHPPVPAIPDQYRVQNPKTPPNVDVWANPVGSYDPGKPLPPVIKTRSRADSDEDYGQILAEQSMSIKHTPVEVMSLNQEITPEETDTDDSPTKASHKRTESRASIRTRSMSTGSSPSKDIMTETLKKPPIRSSEDTVRSDWDTTMRGIMSNFDQFSSFDPSNLENTLFTTPLKKRPPILDRTNSDQNPVTRNDNNTSELSRRSSLPHNPQGNSSPSPASNRAASLDVPSSSCQSNTRVRTPQRQGQGNLPTRSPLTNVFSDILPTSPAPKPDSHRLKMHSRSPASASEPALLGMVAPTAPVSTGTTIRLVSSFNQRGERRESLDSTSPRILPPQLAKGPSASSDDLELRGNELATRCWEEDGGFLGQDKIAEWLGGT
jgi:hypothetical protein